MCIYTDDRDYREWVYLLAETCDAFDIECWDYCAMPNHYHAALFPTLPNISEGVRYLNSEYAKWWNKRHGRVGHVFQGRPKMPIVDRYRYHLELSRYIALNPVRANLVDGPEKWRWSSYAATMGLVETPPFLRTTAILAQFGGEMDTARARYAAFLTEPPRAEFEDRIRSNERLIGDKAFKLSFKAPRVAVDPPIALPVETNEDGVLT
jgi:REP element-mobilizing transposase RayT